MADIAYRSVEYLSRLLLEFDLKDVHFTAFIRQTTRVKLITSFCNAIVYMTCT